MIRRILEVTGQGQYAASVFVVNRGTMPTRHRLVTPPCGMRTEYCDQHVCVFVSPRAYLRNFTFDLQINYDRGWLRLWKRCDTLCTSGFMDDVIFAHSEPDGGISISLQRVTSLRRRVQANAPAASYWLR